MKIICTNGFYEFYPTFVNDIAKFNSIFPAINLKYYNGYFIPEKVYNLREMNFKNEVIGDNKYNCKYSTFSKRDLFKFEGFTFDLKNNRIIKLTDVLTTQDISSDNFSYATKDILQVNKWISNPHCFLRKVHTIL